MSDLRDYILSKLYEMAKAPKKKVEPKKPVKTEPSHEDQEDFAKWQDENNPMSNVQQESKIAFSKNTIAGKAARKTAAETLKHHKAKQQAKPGATPRSVAREVDAFSRDNYKQREATSLKDRMVEILFEAFTGTSRDYVARAMSREGKGSSMKDRSKKGKALASVVNKQPKVVKAKAEKKAADDAQRKANMARGGNSNLRSSDSATHWRNKWPSGSWGSA